MWDKRGLLKRKEILVHYSLPADPPKPSLAFSLSLSAACTVPSGLNSGMQGTQPQSPKCPEEPSEAR